MLLRNYYVPEYMEDVESKINKKCPCLWETQPEGSFSDS